ncbi:MAG: FkbM family methyltransferase [Planctomycetota bacterium]
MGWWYRCKWSLLKRLGDGRIRADVNGIRLALEFTDISARHIYFGEYEKEEAACIAGKIKPGMVTCDIGANLGYFTLLLAHLTGPHGHVYAFEPNPVMQGRLAENILLNPGLDDGRIRLEAVALGAQAGEADFFCPAQGHDGAGGLKDTRRAPLQKVIKVRVTALDEFVSMRSIKKLDFIKMDIEGGELDVLRGAERVLSELRPVILFEACEENTAPYGYRVFDILSYLEQHGYSVKQTGGGYNFLAVAK